MDKTRVSIFDSKTKQFGQLDMHFMSRLVLALHAGSLVPGIITPTRILLLDNEGNVRLDIAEVDAENYN